MNAVLHAYDLSPYDYTLTPIGNGLIHHTYVLVNRMGESSYVLQELNTTVFTRPADIAHNLHLLARFRAAHHPDYLLPLPLPTKDGEPMAVIDGRYYRLAPYVQGSRAYDRCDTPEQAYEAARQFGRFTGTFNGLQTDMLRYTIPGFHDLPFRWQQFTRALEEGNQDRRREASPLIRTIQEQYRIVQDYARIRTDTGFRVRVTHHDTKISNVLFSAEGRGLCVIDLDTVMPGHFISDVGDMMRNYLSPANEEETDFSAIRIRMDYFEAIATGYLGEMGSELTSEEKAHFVYSGKFLTYMQALRFYTDYLRDDG